MISLITNLFWTDLLIHVQLSISYCQTQIQHSFNPDESGWLYNHCQIKRNDNQINESSNRPKIISTKIMVLINLNSWNLDNKPFMNSFSHPCCQKKIISCQQLSISCQSLPSNPAKSGSLPRLISTKTKVRINLASKLSPWIIFKILI